MMSTSISQLNRLWRANRKTPDGKVYKKIINVLWEIGKTDIDVLSSFLYECAYLDGYVYISMHLMGLRTV